MINKKKNVNISYININFYFRNNVSRSIFFMVSTLQYKHNSFYQQINNNPIGIVAVIPACDPLSSCYLLIPKCNKAESCGTCNIVYGDYDQIRCRSVSFSSIPGYTPANLGKQHI